MTLGYGACPTDGCDGYVERVHVHYAECQKFGEKIPP